MSNADQLKYQRMQEQLDKEPTPMRRRTSAPEPIKLPPPQTFDQRIRRNIYEILYHVLRSPARVAIQTMSYQEFVAFCERAIAEDER